jgi:putative solute:sodium symporter small subunit
MAQQGTTIAFIFVTLVYVLIMKRLDMRYLAQCGKKSSEEPTTTA